MFVIYGIGSDKAVVASTCEDVGHRGAVPVFVIFVTGSCCNGAYLSPPVCKLYGVPYGPRAGSMVVTTEIGAVEEAITELMTLLTSTTANANGQDASKRRAASARRIRILKGSCLCNA